MKERGGAILRTKRNKRVETVRHKQSHNLINKQLKDHGLVDEIKYLFTRYAVRFHLASCKDQPNSLAPGMLRPKETQISAVPHQCTRICPLH
jgi:hypothetical protein